VNATSEQTFVAVKGIETQTIPATTTAPAAGNSSVVVSAAPSPVVESNPVQRALSDPKTLTDDFYIIIMFIFGMAVILNTFIKIRIQYPKLIFSGLVVVVAAGIFIILNQNLALIHAAIL